MAKPQVLFKAPLTNIPVTWVHFAVGGGIVLAFYLFQRLDQDLKSKAVEGI